MPGPDQESPGGPRRFATTRWSVVLAAGDRTSPESQRALSDLCGIYWYPLYAFARRRGLGPEEAQDRTQDFFARLLEKNTLMRVDPARGRFRSFLLTTFKNFLEDERIRAAAQKRGGDRVVLPIEIETAEGRYSLEPAVEANPERLFERRWALLLLERTMDRLREEHVRRHREKFFDRLKDYLVGGRSSVPYARAAEDLGISEVGVKVAVHRLRKRFRQLLLDEIAQTVDDPKDVDAEVQHLFTALEERP